MPVPVTESPQCRQIAIPPLSAKGGFALPPGARTHDPGRRAAAVGRKGAELNQLALELEAEADDAVGAQANVLAKSGRAYAATGRLHERREEALRIAARLPSSSSSAVGPFSIGSMSS
jgi:hypothetical protein